MKILKTQVLRGPNIWSNYRKKLIQIRLDLEEMEQFPTDKIPGFSNRLQEMFPGMIEDECSEGIRGGFFIRLERGTWLGHVIEHVALEIQSLAGMKTGYGRTRGTGEKGIYNVVFSYEIEEAGLYAATAAFNIVDALRKNERYDVANDIAALRDLRRKSSLGPSTKSIVEEAAKRGIPWFRRGTDSSIQLGYGINQRLFQATTTCRTNTIAVNLAGNKEKTKRILEKSYIPVANGGICRTEAELEEIIASIGYPIVIKPLNANQGRGATINITEVNAVMPAFNFAQQYGETVIVEKFISGYDFRILVVDHTFIAASKRIPAHIIGDGGSTIAALIEKVNSNPDRGFGHEASLTKISINADTEKLLANSGRTLNSIPPNNERIYLKSTANLSTGGTAIDVTDTIHPLNIFMAERISRIIGLDVCGIDVMANTLAEPLKESGGTVIEVNAAPGFRMHLSPSEGKPRNVAAPVIDMLYPPGTTSRIPIIAVTGTNGKTTTTRLVAHIAKNAGMHVGFTTTDGIYINEILIEAGDNTGPISGKFVLNEPSVDFAVLETARGGILRSGLCFDECDIAIITNIKEDHLGLNDIHSLSDLANIKAVVARSVSNEGWAVLNADDVECVNIARELDCNLAFFSMDEHNEIIQSRISKGKPVAVFENGAITIISKSERMRIENVANIPITFNGNATFMIANALAASLAAYVWGFNADNIRNSLQTFLPGLSQTPGRLNHFSLNGFNILVDYAHNPHGYLAIEDYVSKLKATRKIGIISGIGDRRNDDIRECARIACRMFDHLIIRQEKDLRGSTEEVISGLLLEGISQSGKQIHHEIIPKETDAIRHALSIANKGDLVVALSEDYHEVIEIIKNEIQNEKLLSKKLPADAAIYMNYKINQSKESYLGTT